MTRPGSWCVKWELPSKQVGKAVDRFQRSLGDADDLRPADGFEVLTFQQALAKAMEVAKGRVTTVAKSSYSLGDVLEAYLADKARAGGDSLSRNQSLVEKIKREIGALKMSTLDRDDLERWFRRLATVPPQVRSKKGEGPRFKANFDPMDPDQIRKRQASANKALSLLKAALNQALRDRNNPNVTTNVAWEGIEEFRDVETSRGEALSPTEAAAFLEACTPELRPLVLGGLLTGLRYGELIKLKVKDFRPQQRCIVIDFTKTKVNRFSPLSDEGMAVFLAITKGRSPDEPIFLRADGTAWRRGQQTNPVRNCGKLVNLRTYIYLLRHTCITRWAEAGIPLHVIAQAVGNSVAIIEKHYQHLTPESLHKTLGLRGGSYGISDEDMAEMRAEMERLEAEKGRGVFGKLSFRLSTLHPSQYIGKIRGGAVAPPERPTREQLEALVDEMSLVKIAERYQVKETAVRKWCRNWGIPTKPVGYWAKVYSKQT